MIGSGSRPRLIFDSSSLITAALFKVEGRLVIEFVADWALLIIPESVKRETIDFGLQAGYRDAFELNRLVENRTILIGSSLSSVDSPFEEVITAYEIEPGDMELLRLCRSSPDYDFVIIDDRLLYLIFHRFKMRPMFLPDLIVYMAQEKALSEKIAECILKSIYPRYRRGFIEHSLYVLKGWL